MNNQIKTYKDLKFWQTAKRTGLLVAKLVKLFPNDRTYWIISDQILRAAFSIGANIAEGFGKYKGKEYSRFIRMALGSANEVEYWLELLLDLDLEHRKEITETLSLNTETIKMLTSTVKTLASRP